MQSCSEFYKSPGPNLTAPLTSAPDSQPLYLTASLPALARIKLNFKHLIYLVYFKTRTDERNGEKLKHYNPY